jgi:hypothetical protein
VRNIPDGIAVIRSVLDAAEPRPDVSDKVAEKTKYAIRFADHFARRIADDLKPKLKGILATPQRVAGSLQKKKQLDVNFSTLQHGLGLGISLKSVHLKDSANGRYTHNMKRNEEELRVEASGYHKRQPFAVMVGVVVLPFDCCDDAKRDNASSFGSWVRHLRPHCGRTDPHNEIDRFEQIYVALYEPDGSDLRFFDIESDPPKSGRPPKDGDLLGSDSRPRRLLTYNEFLEAVYHRYLQRNSAEFRWADGEEAPLEPEETEGDEDEFKT